MKRFALALATACLTAVAVPGLASATEVQLGSTATALAAPACQQQATVAQTEADCEIALDQTTVYQTQSDGTANPDLITSPGVIAAFSVGISGLYIQGASLSSLLASADSRYGGPPSVQLTVLRPLANRPGKRWAVAAQSPVIQLKHFISGQAGGSVTEFPLLAPIPVVRGEMVAITIPTWAPILSIGMATTQFAYVQSHSPQVSTAAGASKRASCQNDVSPTRAQLTLGQQAEYRCAYTGARVEYSALEITAPSMHAAIRTHRARSAHVSHHRHARAHSRLRSR